MKIELQLDVPAGASVAEITAILARASHVLAIVAMAGFEREADGLPHPALTRWVYAPKDTFSSKEEVTGHVTLDAIGPREGA